MREPCRVCGICVQGGQCRWLFSACGRLRLAVVLSHVLEAELQRDGRSEFICGKCVFLLERVVQCDVAIGQLQETHAVQLQRLQNERNGLKMHIVNKYRQNYPPKPDGNASRRTPRQEVKIGTNPLQFIRRPKVSSVPPKLRQAQIDEVQNTAGRSQMVVAGNKGGSGRQEKFKGQLRRCVSLEPLSKVGTDRFHHLNLNSSPHQSKDAGFRTIGLSGTQCFSREYLDIVHKKSALISRSTSLQSVALEQSDHTHICASPLRRTHPLKGSAPSMVETTSLVFDILQLLRSVQGVRPVPRCNGSKIPIPMHPHFTHGNACGGVSWKSKVEKSLREMEEDFNDEYTPLKQEVHLLVHLL
ncbi:uncharacterized protein LOC127431178 [Myxocyprinus asiaticus]|uniref:uncharacterized protein LOC127431178 n=1 Tax=Myxocyprinus asiaticus TaxID=70543 RepID=UPI002221859D|nr:uncharacterized protein LOC127431178 [Myxocyprinus asiaticus]